MSGTTTSIFPRSDGSLLVAAKAPNWRRSAGWKDRKLHHRATENTEDFPYCWRLSYFSLDVICGDATKIVPAVPRSSPAAPAGSKASWSPRAGGETVVNTCGGQWQPPIPPVQHDHSLVRSEHFDSRQPENALLQGINKTHCPQPGNSWATGRSGHDTKLEIDAQPSVQSEPTARRAPQQTKCGLSQPGLP
jgi:hypothetical protein